LRKAYEIGNNTLVISSAAAAFNQSQHGFFNAFPLLNGLIKEKSLSFTKFLLRLRMFLEPLPFMYITTRLATLLDIAGFSK